MLLLSVVFALLAWCSSLVSALPNSRLLFEDDCRNITLKDNWLIADCLKNDNSSSTRSTVFLPNWIAVRGGNLTWQKGGQYNVRLLNKCELQDKKVLDCSFHYPNGTGVWYSSTLDLSECIENRNGLLYSCLDDWDRVPAQSVYPVPETFSFTAGLLNKNCTKTGALMITTTAPPEGQGCLAWHTSGRRPVYREAAFFESPNPGWELIAYHSDSCVGEVGRVGPDQGNKCVVFPSRVASFIVRPLWNSGSFSIPYTSPARRDVTRRDISPARRYSEGPVRRHV